MAQSGRCGLMGAVFAAGVGVGGGAVLAQHDGDIAIGVSGGRLATGRFVAGQAVLDERVFLAEFGVFPDFTDEPGFDSGPGVFAPGAQIGFNIRKALRKWDGDFDQIPTETLRIRLGPAANTRFTPVNDTPVAGFAMPVNAQGEYHHHFQYTLQAPASDGVYLLELEMWTSQAGVGASDPLWIVFSQNADDATHEAAAEWVVEHLAGTPCAADLTGDGFVDDTDFVIFAAAYEEFACGAVCPADFTGDGFVDDTDFVIFASAYEAFVCP